ncbi:uncharacterized protein LOC123265989 [Cotesia glomerata]|uniref:Uncharacterized protein n=1 Tax=Cotesia glomerata TaxID=32391 RepID=A0AAV7IHC8_COTGL|nr:uncharacterized protein LOC123265989 [Cotesia glomerata]KAH0561065.1 hypothetical protein KQX54_012056 [Cotesia glomerata]
MGLYCLLTDLNQSKYCIVPTQNVFELNENNNLTRIRSDTYQADKKYYVRGASLQIGIGGFYIIDSHDDYQVLRKRNSVDSRIIIGKLPDYSPSAKSKVSKKAGTSKISNSEQVVKKPDVPRKSTKKSNTVVTARKESEFNSADYYLEEEIATGSGNTRETGVTEETEEGTSKDKNSESIEIAEETGMAAPGNRDTSDNLRNNDNSDSEPDDFDNNKENRSISTKSRSVSRTFQTPRPRTKQFIRRPFCRVQQLKRLQEKNKNKNDNSLQSPRQKCRSNPRILTFTEIITVENNIEFVQIGPVKFTANELSTIVLKKTMLKRAKALLSNIWTSDELKKMYQKCPKNDASSVLISDQHCLRVKDMCLYLQQRKEIKYWENGDDNIDLHLPQWIGTYCNEHRRKLKEQS